MRVTILELVMLATSFAPAAWGDTVLYDNTVTPTPDTVFYSVGPYVALGDQIHLISPGIASQAEVEFYNNGASGTFDAELDFFDVGSPVGAEIGKADLTDIPSFGMDVIDVTFDLPGGLTVPQDLVFTVSVSNLTAGMDLGLDMFQPPDVGYSDPSFMIDATNGPVYSTLMTTDENVYFQLSGTATTAVPEPSTLMLLGVGWAAIGVGAWSRATGSSRA